MRRLVPVAAVLIMLLGLAACGSRDADRPDDAGNARPSLIPVLATLPAAARLG
ncbi:hypothetical protein GVO57_05790 [Sphingomonas changnyeongensis]|uniref:Uncharacterized protein n=1 Tax=Sphingomonas changnyeongensis TaxID=2698679 RepID=A0A7Z2NV86_9SPHN|nr:hypothetical protein [Sphingomonas changnyeongensis]QHL90438.1 hypothetical protein GVO57_05790 [Sphingomonas changnyeongensis]